MKKTIKQIGIFTAILITINGILGSGVFQLPRNLYLQMAGNFWIAIIISAIGAVVLSFCFAFLVRLINNRNGGKYIYAKTALGNKVGSWAGLVNVLAMFIVNAGTVNGFLKVINQYGNHYGGVDWYNAPSSSSLYWLKISLVISIVLIICFLLLKGVKTSKLTNNIITCMKLAPLFVFLFIGLAYMKNTINFDYSLEDIKEKTNILVENDPKSYEVQDVYMPIMGGITGIITIFYAFLGFDSLGNSISIFKKPEKTIPIALGISIFILTIMYIIVFVGTVGILPLDILLKKGVNPIAEAINLTPLKEIGYNFVMIGQLASTLGILFISMFYTPYVLGAMARDGFLPSTFRSKNKHGAYTYGIVLTAIGTIILGLFKFTFLVQINVLTRFVVFDITMIALLIIIKRKSFVSTIGLKISKVLIYFAIIFCSSILLLKFLPFEAFLNGNFSGKAFKPVIDGLTSIGLSFVLFLVSWFYQWKFAEMKENKTYKIFIEFVRKQINSNLNKIRISNSNKEEVKKIIDNEIALINKKISPKENISYKEIINFHFNKNQNEITCKIKFILKTKDKTYYENQNWIRLKIKK